MEMLIGKERYCDPNRHIDWSFLSKEYELDEDFIREHADNVDWHWISCKQKLSTEFLREFKDRVNWNLVALTNNWTEEFKSNIK